MGIFSAIKYALNSTLGTSSFTSLDKMISTADTNVKGLRGGVQTFTSDGTFSVPYGVTKILVTACAGGQAGYASYSDNNNGGYGGDWIVRRPYSVISGSILSITVGKGGTTSGEYGSSTVIENLVTLACPGVRGGLCGIGNSEYTELCNGGNGFAAGGRTKHSEKGGGGGSLGRGGSSGFSSDACNGNLGGGGIGSSSPKTVYKGGDGIVIIEW